MVIICGERPYRTTQRLIGIASGQATHALPDKRRLRAPGLVCMRHHPQGVLLRPGRRAPVCSQRLRKGSVGLARIRTRPETLSSRVEGRG